MEYPIALSQIDYEESQNHGAETSGSTHETPGCKNWFENLDFIIL